MSKCWLKWAFLHMPSNPCLTCIQQLRVVRAVAIFGGFLQIALFMCLCALTAMVSYIVKLMSSKTSPWCLIIASQMSMSGQG